MSKHEITPSSFHCESPHCLTPLQRSLCDPASDLHLSHHGTQRPHVAAEVVAAPRLAPCHAARRGGPDLGIQDGHDFGSHIFSRADLRFWKAKSTG